ncbi:hypothetical protein SAMN02927930_00103 [Pseudidiomarina indica]|uniref:Phage terminase-like protein, large subunit, contains N-terminal HTH domain n=1 Tax=Pseudidiomarina indica TaxID=1159017 RepID=A0A1G6A3A5_9GAMM|nr:hypothetical protein [Pseudidiomarina indica]SDB02875.1 hypothetical protein SAMN02927930_00103 [Pseudidiomarina indica]
MNIIEAMHDENLFAHQFSGESWRAWRVLLSAFYGLPIADDDLALYQELTGRQKPPEAPHNELWLPVGRRGGKSNTAALIAVYEAFFNDYSDKLAAGEVATVMVIAADRKQARSVMRYIRGLVDGSPMLKQMVLRETTESIELVNRCVIEITTASMRATRGYTASCIIADEIAFWLTDGANPDKEIINALRPSLATLNGKLIALSSPYARRGVLWENYRRYFGKDNQRVLVAQAPTLTMNPTLSPEIVAAAYEEDAQAASAEYGAQFRSDVESYISREAVEAVTIPDRYELAPASSNHYFAFVDAAGGSGKDAMTCAIAHQDKEIIIVDVLRVMKPPFSPEYVVEQFCDLLKMYRINYVVGDRWGGDFVREQFTKRGIYYELSEKNKSEIYGEMLPLINSKRVELPDHKQLFDELVGLERKTSSTGKDRIDHAPGMHDDAVNAVAGVCVVASQYRPYCAAPRIGF